MLTTTRQISDYDLTDQRLSLDQYADYDLTDQRLVPKTENTELTK